MELRKPAPTGRPGQPDNILCSSERRTPAFNARNAELAAQGHALQYDNTFKDCGGRTHHQGLWMKAGQ